MRRRWLPALVVFATLALAGCQTPPEPSDDPGCAPEGAAARSISAEGELFTSPTVAFDAPLSTLTTERTVLIEGSGRTAELGSLVTVEFVSFNGRTGDLIESTGYGAAGVGRTLLTLDTESAMPGLRRALLCSTVGSRVAAVVHPGDALGEAASGIGVGADDPIVYVFDVVAIAAESAEGEELPQDPALPSVDASSGTPVIAIPVTPPPTELVASQLIVGDGLEVRAGSEVAVRFHAVLWRNGLPVQENWSAPRLDTFAMDELWPGVADSLVGQTVGSRLLVILPPEFGFGTEGAPEYSVNGSDTLAVTVDILATT